MRGQISLDLILTIAIGFFVIGTVIAVNVQIGEMQQEASIRQQLHDIGNGLAAIISNSAVMNDSDSAIVYFDVPLLLVSGEENPQPCMITIDEDCDGASISGAFCLSYRIYDLESEEFNDIKVLKHYVEPAGMDVPTNANCGERIAITKT